MSDANGTFIVFEGGEGSGKSTQIRLLEEKLPDDTVFTQEPGGSDLAEQIRKIFLDPGQEISVRTELALLCASRADHVEKVIAPALAEGKIVICDRFDLSTIAYQIYGHKQQEHLDYLQNFSGYMVGGTRPDLYIYLDIPVQDGLERLTDREEEDSRMDQKAITFHKRVRKGYKQTVANRDDCVEIDARQSQQAVAEDVWREVQRIIAE